MIRWDFRDWSSTIRPARMPGQAILQGRWPLQRIGEHEDSERLELADQMVKWDVILSWTGGMQTFLLAFRVVWRVEVEGILACWFA